MRTRVPALVLAGLLAACAGGSNPARDGMSPATRAPDPTPSEPIATAAGSPAASLAVIPRTLSPADDGRRYTMRVGSVAELIVRDPNAPDPVVEGQSIQLVEVVEHTGERPPRVGDPGYPPGPTVIRAGGSMPFVITIDVRPADRTPAAGTPTERSTQASIGGSALIRVGPSGTPSRPVPSAAQVGSSDDHLSRLSEGEQARGDVRRVTDDTEAPPVLGADVADNRQAGVHADPEAWPIRLDRRDAPASLDDREGGRGRALGMIRLVAAGVEARHNAVAGEVLDDPTGLVDHRNDHRPVGVEHQITSAGGVSR